MLAQDGQTLTVVTETNISSLSMYELKITDSTTNGTIAIADYMTSNIRTAPVVNQDESLVKYLPYETPSYILSYLADKHAYVFNLKYNPKAAGGDVESQYESAKAEALAFIRSKGIDPSKLVIDWRYS
jgi:hypothetical protein